MINYLKFVKGNQAKCRAEGSASDCVKDRSFWTHDIVAQDTDYHLAHVNGHYGHYFVLQ